MSSKSWTTDRGAQSPSGNVSSETSTAEERKPLPERVEVGWIRRPHGIRGEVLIAVESDNPDRFLPGSELTVVPTNGPRESVRIADNRTHNKGTLLRFEGFHGREEVEPLKGARLEVERSRVPPAPEGTFYFYELVDCRCRDSSEGDLGSVVDVVEDGGGVLLVVESDRGELLIPFVRKYLKLVDVEQGRIELDLPPGLIEICGSRS